jgi:hypothetical protein
MSKPATVEEYRAASGLGGFRRECNQCGAPWEMGLPGCPQCGGLIFDEFVIPVVPFTYGPDGVIQRVVPETPKPPPMSAEDATVLRRAAEAGRVYVAALIDADAASRRLINASGQLGDTRDYLQFKIATAVGATGLGDASTDNLKPLAPSITLLSALIDTAVLEFEEETKT